MGEIGLAIVACVIGSPERDGHSSQPAYFAALQVIGVLTLAAAAVALLVRAWLVDRGRTAPLSMRSS
jgi:hypothetical protein